MVAPRPLWGSARTILAILSCRAASSDCPALANKTGRCGHWFFATVPGCGDPQQRVVRLRMIRMESFDITMVDLVPRPAADLETDVIEGEVLLYEPQQTRAVYLSPTAALVFGLCDGRRSVREIIRVLSECYDGTASLSDDVLTTINELRESGVLAIG
jgi:hypothetical protein